MEFKLDDSSVIVLQTTTARARDADILGMAPARAILAIFRLHLLCALAAQCVSKRCSWLLEVCRHLSRRAAR